MQWHLAAAHPNFALVKYWGKQPGPHNVPAVESISATVDGLCTQVALRLRPEASEDQLWTDGVVASAAVAARLRRFVDLFRARSGSAAAVEVHSRSNFPAAAGLASSASAFAALTLACDQAFALGGSSQQLADWARQGSGSAARSIFGGLVHLHLQPQQSLPTRIEALPTRLPLACVIAITSLQPKAVGSTAGMERSRLSSPFYAAWLQSQGADVAAARAALAADDFAALAEVAEHSCLKMHAVMQSSRPPLCYPAPVTWAAMARVQALRKAGQPSFFTVDAGPQLKAFCLPAAVAAVRAALGELPGVAQVRQVGLGAAASVSRSAHNPLREAGR